jgi:hypothetical protein
VAWHGSRSLVAEDVLVAHVASLLSTDRREPIGLLTHHLVHDPWIWNFVDRLLERLCRSTAIRFARASTLIRNGAGAASAKNEVEPQCISE